VGTSLPTVSVWPELAEPSTTELAAGVKAAVSCADPAPNEVWQRTVTL
jgi:hypothetical protein